MKKYLAFALFFCVLSCQTVQKVNKVQTGSQAAEERILFTVDGEPVTISEFEYVYKKNNVNNDSAFTRNDVEDYLELYKKFKLKIAEAKSQGLDTTSEFLKEFSAYKEQLKKPYLTETKVTEQLVEEAYDRFETEVNASHILVKLPANPSPEDTLAAYEKALSIKKQAAEGTAFSKLAKQYSDDPSAAKNGGDLGYFSSFQMVYPFESAAYATPEGEISAPVRTKFGYHLIKVNDKRPSQGTVTVSHLMIRIKPNKEDSAAARNKIFELYEQATGGVNWEQLVEQFSDDVNSKKKGGLLQPFKVGQMPYSFQEAAFALKEEGEISDPVMTPYGWHLIRLENREPLQSLEEMKDFILPRVKRDARADMNRSALIKRLKEENGFKENKEIKASITQYADSSLLKGTWKYQEDLAVLNEQLFTIGKTDYDVASFFEYLQQSQQPTKNAPSSYMMSMYNQFVDATVIQYEEDHLEEKYYDYKMLVQEYREGIMLFQLMEDEVWQKAVDDTVGLKQFYDDSREKYKWGQRLRATVYTSQSADVITEIEELIAKDDSLAWSKKGLEDKYNKETALTLQVESGIYEAGDQRFVDEVKKTKGVHKLTHNGRHVMVYVHEVVPPAYKPLDKIKGLVISDYQNHLEKEWLEQLKLKYPVEVNEEELRNVYKTLVKN